MVNKGLMEALEELDKELLNPNLIQDNKIHFQEGDIIYRVCMPTQLDLSQAETAKNAKYVELIQRDNTLTKKKMIEALKEKQDIDIDAMQIVINELESKMYEQYMNLAQKKDSEKKAIAKCKVEIAKVSNKRKKLIYEMTELLSPCIEIQVENEYMEFLTVKCTEKHSEEKKWQKVWPSFTEYDKDISRLSMRAIGYLTHLMLSLRG